MGIFNCGRYKLLSMKDVTTGKRELVRVALILAILPKWLNQ